MSPDFQAMSKIRLNVLDVNLQSSACHQHCTNIVCWDLKNSLPLLHIETEVIRWERAKLDLVMYHVLYV